MSKRTLPLALAAGLLLVAPAAAPAKPAGHGHGPGHGGKPGYSSPLTPQTIALPPGFQPEGITSKGSTLYAGSLKDGAIWAGSAKTGKGRVLVPGVEGRATNGITVSGNKLIAAGGRSGLLLVHDRRTGRTLRSIDVDGTFINDVALLGRNAYFTDSEVPVLYVLRKDGRGAPSKLPLTGDLQYGEGLDANGIVAAGRKLVTVQSSTGKLFSIDPRTGVTKAIDLGGATLPNGDGLLLEGRTLYVVQNRLNKIATVKLSRDLSSGTITGALTDPDFDVPTTITRSGRDLFAVNARFGTTPAADTAYAIVRVG